MSKAFLSEPVINQEEFERQKELLRYYLTEHETGRGKFVVLNNEAGFGKSRMADGVMRHGDGSLASIFCYMVE